MTTKMNLEAKEKIVAALRSGKYEQGKGTLFDGKCHCVWGVICDVSGVGEWKKEETGSYTYDGIAGFPADSVREWVGLGGSSGSAVVSIHNKLNSILTHNDCNDATFAELADAIEEQL